MHETSSSSQSTQNSPQVGRNEPCPCGSNKKYKRCCGINAAPKLSTPAAWPPPALMSDQKEQGSFAGSKPLPFDPSQIDPEWMTQFSQALRRLPKGQMQRMQAMMQKAMAGKDVSREAAEFERTLPPQFQALLQGFQMPTGLAASGQADSTIQHDGQQVISEKVPQPTEVDHSMSAEDAKRIVQEAVQAGKISSEEASNLLAGPSSSEGIGSEEAQKLKESKFGKLWRSIKGK